MSSYETLANIWHKTITYSNIFDYPLTKDEVRTLAISDRPIQKDEFEKWYKKNQSSLLQQYTHDGTYWALPNREAIFVTREKRNAISKKKLSGAKWLTLPLWVMPWIHLIAVTGTTAAHNAKQIDDIDLFIITSPNRTWFTRATVLMYLTILRKRHNKHKSNRTGGYCLNHIVATNQLTDPNQDIYVANEVIRMHVLWSRSKVLSKFIASNTWLRQFVRPWYETHKPATPSRKKYSEESSSSVLDTITFVVMSPIKTPFIIFSWILDWLENATRRLQQDNSLGNQQKGIDARTFHLHDNRDWVIREYRGIVGES